MTSILRTPLYNGTLFRGPDGVVSPIARLHCKEKIHGIALSQKFAKHSEILCLTNIELLCKNSFTQLLGKLLYFSDFSRIWVITVYFLPPADETTIIFLLYLQMSPFHQETRKTKFK